MARLDGQVTLEQLGKQILALQKQISEIQAKNQTDYSIIQSANKTKNLFKYHSDLSNKIAIKEGVEALDSKLKAAEAEYTKWNNYVAGKVTAIAQTQTQLNNDKHTMTAQFKLHNRYELKHHGNEWKSDCAWRISPPHNIKTDSYCQQKVQDTKTKLQGLENEKKTGEQQRSNAENARNDLNNQLKDKQKEAFGIGESVEVLNAQAAALDKQLKSTGQTEQEAVSAMSAAQERVQQYAADYALAQTQLSDSQELQEVLEADRLLNRGDFVEVLVGAGPEIELLQ
jgi:chromosome segregation ATPase